MWTSLALAAALSLAQADGGDLQVTNDRPTFGFMGPSRAGAKVLPGDAYFISFDIDNLKLDKAGKVQYSMKMEMHNAKGEKQYGKDPQDLEAYMPLGGSKLPAFAGIEIGTETLPGEYTLTLTVTDRAAKKSSVLKSKFEVVPKDFGIVGVNLAYNFPNLPPAPPVLVAGQSLVINFRAIGFKRNDQNNPDVKVEMAVLDEEGKQTIKPFEGGFKKDVPKDVVLVPMQFLLDLNRAGKYTIQLKATDNLAKKDSEASFKITVVEAK